MNLSHITQEIYKAISAIHAESYQEINPSRTIKYPYLTYSHSAEGLEFGTEGMYLDIDIFERNTSFVRMLQLENALKNGLDRKQLITDEAMLRFKFNASSTIPTQDNDLKRRNLRFYIKIDWRDLNGKDTY